MLKSKTLSALLLRLIILNLKCDAPHTQVKHLVGEYKSTGRGTELKLYINSGSKLKLIFKVGYAEFKCVQVNQNRWRVYRRSVKRRKWRQIKLAIFTNEHRHTIANHLDEIFRSESQLNQMDLKHIRKTLLNLPPKKKRQSLFIK